MSLIKVQITPDHLKLLKNLKWSINDGLFIETREYEDTPSPFGGDDIYEDINLILNGRPENFDPFNTEDLPEFSEEQKAEWLKLYKDLPYCLEIILGNETFGLGKYAAKFHDRIWKKKD